MLLPIIIATGFVISQQVTVLPLAALTVSLLGLSQPADAFFGLFRRRRHQSPVTEIDPLIPQGSIDMADTPVFGQGPLGNIIPSQMWGQQFNPFNPFGGMLPQFGRPGQFGQGQFMNQPIRSEVPVQTSSGSAVNQFVSGSQPNQFVSNGHPNQFVPVDQSQGEELEQVAPGINTEEAESFFTLLAETDENQCISRLVCEMGADPSSAGELGQTITEIIGSLSDFPEGTKVSQYNLVLQRGRTEGMDSCITHYLTCDDESYQMMRNSQAEQEFPEDAS